MAGTMSKLSVLKLIHSSRVFLKYKLIPYSRLPDENETISVLKTDCLPFM